MKIKTIPQEYEAIQFNGLTQDIEDFIANTDAKIYKSGEDFVLSNVIGNHGLNIGDYLYKHDSPLTMIGIAHNDNSFKKYFEVIK